MIKLKDLLLEKIEMDEVMYPDMVGIHELSLFYDNASPNTQSEVEDLLSTGHSDAAWDIIRNFLRTIGKLTQLDGHEVQKYITNKNAFLCEGSAVDNINNRIKILEAEWERLDSQGTGYARQMQIQQEIAKLWRELERWNKLNAAVDNPVNENTMPSVILGAIWPDDEIRIIKGETDDARHPFNWSSCNKWRYVPDVHYLTWWECPSGHEVEMVKHYLEDHGFPVKSQGALGYITENITGDDTVFGGIWGHGRIVAYVASDSTGVGHTRDMGSNRWTYYQNMNSVFWKHLPDADDKFAVENWLTKRGYKVTSHRQADDYWALVVKLEQDKLKKQKLSENVIMEGKLEETAEDFIKQIINGTEWDGLVYACGGYVRDQISGRDAKDLDIVVDKENGGILFSNWITKKIGNYKEHSNPVTFEKFGTSKFNLNGITHNGISLTGFEIEAVMPRSEKYTAGSRHPEVQSTNLKGDAYRRDITYNSLYKNISTGEILDLTGKGLEDLKNGVIRTPIDPDKTFKDDPLRQLRIVRFYAKYGHEIPLYIIKSLKRNAGELKNISAERIQSELNKMLVTTRPEKALKLLKITGLLDYIIPEFKAAYKLGQNKFHKSDVWMHSIEVMKKTKPELLNRLVSLLHDIGKTKTKTIVDGEVHFYAHEKIGSEMAKEILTRLKYPTEIIDAVVVGIANHMRLKRSGDDGEVATDKALRKFSVDLGDHLETMLDVMEADNASHEGSHTMPNQIPNIRARIEKLKNSIPAKNAKLPVTGKDLMDLGLRQGPLFKELLDLVRDKQLENPDTTKEEYLNLIKAYLASKS